MTKFNERRCRLNHCGRPFGIGTHMVITGNKQEADQTLQVCEEHWQALRPISRAVTSNG